MEQVPNITDIPVLDIYKFLRLNGISLATMKTQKEAYQVANELIMSNQIDKAPSTIVNYMLAYNASKQYNIPYYSKFKIITSSNDDLIDLSRQLGLNEVNKHDIIEILTYMHKLHDNITELDMLPNEVLTEIMLGLDLPSMQILANSSAKMNRIYRQIRG